MARARVRRLGPCRSASLFQRMECHESRRLCPDGHEQIRRSGPNQSPLRYSNPEFCARPNEKCSDSYAIRLWYALPFTAIVGGHILVIDFDDRQRVVDKSEMFSP